MGGERWSGREVEWKQEGGRLGGGQKIKVTPDFEISCPKVTL